MARIPIQPGSVIAQPAPQGRQFPAAAFGGMEAQAYGDVATSQLQRVLGEEREDRIAAAEQARQEAALQRERDREAAAIKKAADDAKSLAVVTEAEDGLADLHDRFATGIRDGSIPRDKAEELFNEEAGKVIGKAGEAMPVTLGRETALVRLRAGAARLGNGVRKAITDRDRRDVTAGLEQTLEYTSRLYRTDPQRATLAATAAIEKLGPASSLAPEQVARLGQTWRETVHYNAGRDAVSAGRYDPKALAAAEALLPKLEWLDEGRRVELQDRIQGFKVAQQNERDRARERALREQEHRLREAERVFDKAAALAQEGTLAPEYADSVLKDLRGTPFADMFRASLAAQRETGPLAARPVAELRTGLDALNAEIAREGLTPQRQKARNRIGKVLDAQERDLREHGGIRAWSMRGAFEAPPPLNMAAGLPAMAQQMGQRVELAKRASSLSGRVESPLYPEEAAGLKRMLDQMPAKERSQAVSMLAQQLGPEAAQGLAAQIDKDDRALALSFAYAGQATTAGRLVSELVLRGQMGKADGTSTKGDKEPAIKANRWKAFAAAELEGVFANRETAARFRDAAELIMHGMAAEGGGRLSQGDMERAVRLAIGGELVEHAGAKVPVPPGMSAGDLSERLRTYNVGDLAAQTPGGTVIVNGAEMAATDFLRHLPNQPLVPLAPGEYGVLFGGRAAMSRNGQPITIKVR